MNGAATIRKLDQNDANAWARLRQNALEAHPLAFGSSVPDDPASLVEIGLSRLESSSDAAVFGAFVGNALTGIVGIRRDPGLKERHISMIWGMYVSPHNRRNGTGELLLKSAIRHARLWDGVCQVHLVVNDVASEAKRLYERNGFRAWGRQPRALYWDELYVDAIHMMLDLRECE